MRAAPRSRTAAPPIAIPPIAPSDKGWLDDAEVADGAAVAVGDDDEVVDRVVGTISEGKNCPGLNINVAFLAYASCVSNVSVAF
jgi:hypothetical protein